MRIERLDEVKLFRDGAGSFLLADEARPNLLLGILDTLERHPDVYEEHRMWLIRDGAAVVGAALRTPPFNLVVARPSADGAIDHLADTLREQGEELPGVTGADPEVRSFAEAWTARNGGTWRRKVGMGVYELTDVADVPRPEGAARPTTEVDRWLLTEWISVFAVDIGDAAPPAMRDLDQLARMVDARLPSDDRSGYWLWSVPDALGTPVAVAGFSGATGTGIRVGPVYTPAEHRRRGYATALVAEMSTWLIDGRYRACFLFTDLANPTSNAIYERIGYRKICEALDIVFETTPEGTDHHSG